MKLSRCPTVVEKCGVAQIFKRSYSFTDALKLVIQRHSIPYYDDDDTDREFGGDFRIYADPGTDIKIIENTTLPPLTPDMMDTPMSRDHRDPNLSCTWSVNKQINIIS